MGIPVWASGSSLNNQTSSRESGYGKFPIHRLENSPIIANYTGEERKPAEPAKTAANLTQTLPPPSENRQPLVRYGEAKYGNLPLDEPDFKVTNLDATSVEMDSLPALSALDLKATGTDWGAVEPDLVLPGSDWRAKPTSSPNWILLERDKKGFQVKQGNNEVVAPVLIKAPGLHEFPNNTKVKAANQTTWYKQFARNMGGMLDDKPYRGLTWPPNTD